MADNLTIPATGSGTATPVVATDDVSSVHFQKVKLDVGGDGVSAVLATGAGAVSTGVPRVTLASDDPAVASLAALDNAISGNEMQVDVVGALPAGTNAIGKLAANSGVDIGDVDVASIAAGDNNIGNVDIVTMPNVTLAAGTNTNEVVGDAAHDAAVSGNPLLVGAYAKATAPTDVSTDGDAVRLWADLAGRLQVGDGGQTLSVDDNGGNLSIDDGGNSITVDNGGTFAVQAAQATAANLNMTEASAAAILAATGATNGAAVVTDANGTLQQYLRGIVKLLITSGTIILGAGTNAIGKLAANSGVDIGDVDVTSISAGDNNIGNVDIVTMPTVTVNAHAVTNAGTFATQVDGAALTALQLIDDPVLVDDAAFTVGTSKVMAVGINAVAHGSNPDAADAGDAVIPIANRHRVQWTIGGHPNAKTATYLRTDAATDDNVMAAIAGGTKYAVTRITITLDEAATVGVAVRLGFGTSTVPALPSSGGDAVDDILVYHPGLVPGGGLTIGDGSGVLGVGGDGAELRITSEAPTGGMLAVSVTYFTIES